MLFWNRYWKFIKFDVIKKIKDIGKIEIVNIDNFNDEIMINTIENK